jgi:transcriptional regulator with XRE-family HTH domain
MPESFGARLRQQREQQGITLAAITEQTKIKQSLLEGLERGEVSHWPGGLFRRAYVRAYAHAIGLNPELVVREFLQLHPDPTETVEPLPGAAETNGRGPASGTPPTRISYVFQSAVRSLSRRQSESGQLSILAGREALASQSAATTTGEAGVEPDVAPTDEPGVEPVIEATVEAVVEGIVEVAEPVSPAEEPTVAPAVEPARAEARVDLLNVAALCTAFGRVATSHDLAAALADAARLLDAVGLVVWIWNGQASRLVATLAHGYSERVLAQIPALERDAPNATAAAFRLEQPCTVNGLGKSGGALVVPLLAADGCAGVLAVECRDQAPSQSAPALAAIVASQLVWLLEPDDRAESASRSTA